MEPVDYLKILKKHWKLLTALIIFAVGVVYLISPAEATRSYRAEHLLAVSSTSGEEVSMELDNLTRAELFVATGEVPEAAAELLAPDGDQPDAGDLAESIQAEGDPERGTLTIVANASDPDEAVDIANAFGLAFIEYVAEEYGAPSSSGDEDGDNNSDNGGGGPEAELLEEEEIILRMAEIDDLLEREELPDNAVDLRAERTELERILNGESTSGPIAYETVTPARTASSDSAMFETREERMALAAGIALLLGFGVAIVLDRNDTRLRTKEQTERRFGLPVLAEVPLLPLRERGRAAVAAYEREAGLAEAYRSLRTALMLFRGFDSRSGGDKDERPNGNGHPVRAAAGQDVAAARQLVVVTSAEPGDGKSTTAANLAVAYAEAGQSVLILTWDLWRPLSPAVFGAADGPGITDFLEDAGPPLLRYVQDTAIPGVRIVTAGTLSGRPSTRPDMVRDLLDEARSLAAVVIVDTAPLLSASVTREVATLADAVLIVSRVGRTTADAADRCTEMLERIGANALGVVLIGVATGAFSDYYGPSRKAGYDSVPGPRRKPATAGGQGAASTPGSSGDHREAEGSAAGSEPGAGGRHLRQSSNPYRATTPTSPPRAPEDRDHER